MRYLTIALSFLAALPAAAQQADAGVVDEPTADAGVVEAQPLPMDVPDVAETTPSSTSEQMDTLGGRLSAIESQVSELASTVTFLNRIKFSGYVQAQFVYAQNSVTGVDSKGAAAVKDGFSIRRGRLKVEHSAEMSNVMAQIDYTGKEVALRDAEATLIEPWTGQKLAFTVGQFKYPFGFETVQSSGDREFPERSKVIRSFFPGERDRGARLAWRNGPFRAWASIVDGNGIQASNFIGVDNDREKDLTGRVAVDFGHVAFGVSGYYGKTFKPGVYTTTPPTTGEFVPRNRWGADAQAYVELLPIGATAIKGEWITGTSWWSNGVEKPGVPAMGWYASVVQSLGLSNEIGVRFDYFDPAMGTAARLDSADPTKPSSTNPIETIDVVATHYFDESLKALLSYEHSQTVGGGDGAIDPKDDVLTFRMQARF